MSIKFEDEKLKELSVKFTGCICYGLYKRYSICHLIVNLVSAYMKHHGGNTDIQTAFQT